jgi:hypothetical protein
MCKNLKLSPRFFRPFQILYKIETVAYKLDLPKEARIHLVFHVSCLKKKVDQHITPLLTLPLIDSNGELKPELEHIVDRRMAKKNDQPFMEVLICWMGAPAIEDTWEGLWKLQS